MPRNPKYEKITTNIRAGDMDELKTFCEGKKKLTPSGIIRGLIIEFVDKKVKPAHLPTSNIEDIQL